MTMNTEARHRRWSMLAVCLAVTFCCQFSRGQEDVADSPKGRAAIDTTPVNEPPITDRDRHHWAFLPIRRGSIRVTPTGSRLRTPIDAFIAVELQEHGGDIAGEAERLTLIRRLSLDLRGVPPTPEEVLAFEADQSPDAYERLVDRLLAVPALGERYAQYWLDLARFAETDGYEHDKVRPGAWRYRDWLIAALNADMPYDEFMRLQLAGDEVASQGSAVGNREGEAPAEPSASNSKSKIQNPKSDSLSLGQIASMFCLAGPDMPDINDQLERRHGLMNEMTATVGAVFLGLQFGCAQCHNHKYDPISQGDFYRLRALFEPAVPQLKRDVPVATLASGAKPVVARLWVRGDHRRPGVELSPAFPRIASAHRGTRSAEREAEPSSRSALAAWLTEAENPLTARVIANRLWQWHFGRGLCVTPSDFGLMGSAPTHPELLDWLASEMREGQWSMKRVHRLIVSSATYRQASISDFRFPVLDSSTPSTFANPESKIQNPKLVEHARELYFTFPRQRLSGEAIRDSVLAAAGLLSSERGGPGVMPPLPAELLGTLLKGQWTASKREADHYKRSVYVFARRNLRYPIFEAFDRPDGNASCPVRNRSTTAPQSLLLFNSEFSLLAARHLAGRLFDAEESKNQTAEELHRELVERLYLIALSRRPTTKETATLGRFLKDQRDRLATEGRPRVDLALPIDCPNSVDHFAAAALVDACLAILNSNEFIYVD